MDLSVAESLKEALAGKAGEAGESGLCCWRFRFKTWSRAVHMEGRVANSKSAGGRSDQGDSSKV